MIIKQDETKKLNVEFCWKLYWQYKWRIKASFSCQFSSEFFEKIERRIYSPLWDRFSLQVESGLREHIQMEFLEKGNE